MQTPPTIPTISKELDEGKVLDLKAVAKHQAEKFLLQMELRGEVLTKHKEWNQFKAMYIAGFVPGADFGFELATRLSKLPVKKEDAAGAVADENPHQMELFV